MTRRKPTFMDQLMAEPVRMPGVPALIVTRDFLWSFLKSHGWNQHERGFGSMEYLVFGRATVQAELTDVETRDHYLGQVADDYRRERAA